MKKCSLLGLVLVLALVLCACGAESMPVSSVIPEATPTPEPTPMPTPTPEPTPVGGMSIFSDYVYYSNEELFHRATIVLSCKLDEVSDAFRLETSEEAMNYTDYYFLPTEIFRGEEFVGDYVAVRVRGGIAGGYNIQTNDPAFEFGKEYLLLLQAPENSTYCRTEDEHFHVIGGSQSVWDMDGTQLYRGSGYNTDMDGTRVYHLGEPQYDLDEFREIMAEFNEADPPDPDKIWEEELAHWAEVVEDGRATQEEADAIIARRDEMAVYLTEPPRYSKAK